MPKAKPMMIVMLIMCSYVVGQEQQAKPPSAAKVLTFEEMATLIPNIQIDKVDPRGRVVLRTPQNPLQEKLL